MPKYKVGRPPENPNYAGLLYTHEQVETLERIRDPRFAVRVAKAEYAGKVLLPDGSIMDDNSELEANAQRNVLQEKEAANTPEKMIDLARKMYEASHVQQHIDEGRFLFVVNEEGVPLIYFQCAVPGNPDEAEWQRAE